jgi:putative hydroxymethylpyrimidine transport system substrate-binding protein
VRLVLEYFHPWPNSAGLHLGSARGWLPEMEISTYDPLVGDGLAHLRLSLAELAIVPTNRLLVQRERGLAARAVAAIGHRALETIQTVRATAITRPRELEGRRLALNPTPRGVAMVGHLVAADGGDPAAVRLVDSGFREWPASLLGDAGPADATFGGHWAWDVLLAGVPADEHVVWPVDEIGAPRFQPYLLVARDDVADDTVAAVLAGAERGFRAAANAPDEALAVLDRVVPYLPRDVVARSLQLVAPTWLDAAGRWGWIDVSVLEEYATWLAGHSILHAPSRAFEAVRS